MDREGTVILGGYNGSGGYKTMTHAVRNDPGGHNDPGRVHLTGRVQVREFTEKR